LSKKSKTGGTQNQGDPGVNPGRKRILVCSNAYPPHFIGGAELIAHYQAKAMKKLGHEVAVFAGDEQSRAGRYSLRKEAFDGLTVHRVSLIAQDYRPDFVNFYHPTVERRFDDLLDAFSPDVVQMHNLIGLSCGLIHRAKRRGIRTVVTLHDHWGFCYRNTLLKPGDEVCRDYAQCASCMSSIFDEGGRDIPIRMRRDFLAIQLSEADTFVVPSRYLAGAYRRAGIPESKIRVIGYGIDLDKFRTLSKAKMKGAVRFTFIGYLGRHKGVHTLLEALSFLGGKDRVRVNIVGVGDQSDSYVQQVKRMGWGDVVKFWGRVDNRRIEKVYCETDVLILPSIWPENQPVTITEAMAARIPVIASRIGGIPELVEEGSTGYLFDAGDASQLAGKMMEFIAHPERLDRFGENSYHKIEPHTFENQVEKILKVYVEDLETETKDRADVVVGCIGKHVDPECRRAMESSFGEDASPCCRFVLSEWMQEDHLRRSDLVWVVDRSVGLPDVIAGLRNQLPLVVPEENTELTELCRSANCGLYYRDAHEARACLEYLVYNESAARAIGRNGYRFFKERGYERSFSARRHSVVSSSKMPMTPSGNY
jgi:glycosyltransferase involved in cell wall biosynthesis